MDITQNVRMNVINLREMRGWSQDELAVQLNKSKGWVSHLESGKRGITTKHLELLSSVFDVGIHVLLSGVIYNLPKPSMRDYSNSIFSEVFLTESNNQREVVPLPKIGVLTITVLNGQIQDIEVQTTNGKSVRNLYLNSLKESFIEDIAIVVRPFKVGGLVGQYSLNEEGDIAFTSLKLTAGLRKDFDAFNEV